MFYEVYKIPLSLKCKIKQLNMFSNDEITFIKKGHSFKAIINNAEVDIRILSNFLFIKAKDSTVTYKISWILDEIFDNLFDEDFLNFTPYIHQEKKFFLAMDNVKLYYFGDSETVLDLYQEYLYDDIDCNEHRFSHAIIKKDDFSFIYIRNKFSTEEKNGEDVKKLYEKFFK